MDLGRRRRSSPPSLVSEIRPQHSSLHKPIAKLSELYLPIIFNPLLHELPSYQTLIKKIPVSQSRGRRKASHIASRTVEPEDSNGMPLRDYPVSIQQKKQMRASRDFQTAPITRWQQFVFYWERKGRQFVEASKLLGTLLQFWKQDIHDIEGKFGTGIQSYFSFLRFLVLLNFVIFLLMFCFVTLPMVFIKQKKQEIENIPVSYNSVPECTVYDKYNKGLVVFYSYVIDLLTGTGFLEHTYLFYGYYKIDHSQINHLDYNLPLAYFLTTGAYILLSLVWIVKRAVEGFKQNVINAEDRFQSFCNKIFAGWDFCISDEHAAQLKHSSLLYELQTDLEEERIKQKIAERTKKEKLHIYFIRAVLNLIVAMVLCVCFYCIYKATIISEELDSRANNPNSFLENLMLQYLPSIVITAANLITPVIFEHLIRFEDYSPAFEIKFILIRSVFVRLANIIVLLLTLWSQITTCDGNVCEPCGYNHKLYQCWESRVGQEMYKLMIFDFIIIASVTLFVEFPRKLIVTYCTCAPAKWWGQQQFAIPQNVLEIVYGQTICWIGTFYSPLLPGIATVKYIIIFYIKKITLMQNCRPSTRPFRASSSNFFFLGVLLLGLPLACVPILFSVAEIASSDSCGPFVTFNTTWQVIPSTVHTFPKGLRNILYGLGSEAFAVPFFMVVCLILFYFMALAGAHKRIVEQLRVQLSMESRDKQFLIRKLTEVQTGAAARKYANFPSGNLTPINLQSD